MFIFLCFAKNVTLGGNHIFYNSTNKNPGENPSNGKDSSFRVSMLDFPYARSFMRGQLGQLPSENMFFDPKSGMPDAAHFLFFHKKSNILGKHKEIEVS